MDVFAVDASSGEQQLTGALVAERVIPAKRSTALGTESAAPAPPGRVLESHAGSGVASEAGNTGVDAMVDAEFAALVPAELSARLNAEELAGLEAAGALVPPDDLYDPDDPDAEGPVWLSEEDPYEAPVMSRVDAVEWELWAGVEQDEAERFMLRQRGPEWVFLPPGGELAAALEPVRPGCESPMALIEVMKAAARMVAWAESIKAAAMASFYRQRKAQATEIPRPTQVDASGRPIDPERSWAGEIGAALHLTTDTAARHIETALHLTGTLTATHTALRCGALTWSKALAISEATRPLSAAAAQAVEAHVLRRAAGQTHKNLGESLRRQVAKHTTREDAERHRAAVTERTCKIVPLADGMAGLWVVHTADKIQQMWVVIQAMADLAKRGTPTKDPATPTDDPSTGTPTNTPTTDDAGTGTGTDDAGTPTGDGTGSMDAAVADTTVTDTETAVTDFTDIADTGGGLGSGGTGNRADGSAKSIGNGVGDSGNNARNGPGDSGGGSGGDSTTGRAASTGDYRGVAETAGAAGAAGAEPGRRKRDERTAEQRRADVVADVFQHMLHNGLDWLGRRLPDRHRRRPHIEVVIPATTLLGIDDDPAELTGYGPIPADMARRIATDGTWRRLLTDPINGAVLEASTTRHDPGTLVTETLLARHPVCAWPGCNRQSRDCDRDHTTPFARTGQTSLAGLAPYCEYHHVIKDTPAWGWTTTSHPDGSVTLTAPTGHRYTTVPPARGPITQPDPNQHPPTRPPADDPPPF